MSSVTSLLPLDIPAPRGARAMRMFEVDLVETSLRADLRKTGFSLLCKSSGVD